MRQEVLRCAKRFSDALPSDLDVGGSSGYAGLGMGRSGRRWLQWLRWARRGQIWTSVAPVATLG